MNRSILYMRHRLKWLARKYLQKFGVKLETPTIYAGKTILSLEDANAFIERNVRSGQPFAACRFGSTELSAFWPWDSPLPIRYARKVKLTNNMQIYSGFFPLDVRALEQFAELMRNSCEYMDTFAVWFNSMEEYAIEAYGRPREIIQLCALEPWYVEKPWTAALAGKKVLVIHPFKDTILKQYEKRENLFENPDILPEFAELHVVQAVQTIAGNEDERFATWFDALEWMCSEAMKIDFDVAIIGCGAYGFPLAAKIKAAGKQAIHMGGATQLLFGIKGKRWTNHPVISKLFNEYWVNPAESEQPKNTETVEGACYW